MATVSFTANLQRHVECPSRDVEGATVRAVLDRVFTDNPRLRGYIVDETGALRLHMLIFVDGTQIADREQLSDPVRSTSEVYVIQSLSGG
ncbi:MAG: thiamine S [Deltaproteobacteria bacterium]|nr:thiamine S [Deltaproteobacteria bacterium]